MTTYVGIDNGLTGAMAVLRGRSVRIEPFRQLDGQPDYRELHRLIGELTAPVHVMIEPPAIVARKYVNYHAVAQANRAYAAWCCALTCSDVVEWSDVRPAVWQSWYWCSGTAGGKDRSRAMAAKLYPELDLRSSDRARKFDHNYTDALLIAHYCMVCGGLCNPAGQQNHKADSSVSGRHHEAQ